MKRWCPSMAMVLACGLGAALAQRPAAGADVAAPAPAGTPPAVEAAPAGAQLQPGAVHLRPFQARYAFYWHNLQAGTITFTLHQQSGDQWLYESMTEPRGVFRLVPGAAVHISSRMLVDDSGVRPIRFEGYEGDSKAPSAELDFDWQAMHVRGHMKDSHVDMALRPGVQDDLSVMISLLHALELGSVPKGIALFDKDGIRDYDYSREGDATVATPYGKVAAEVYRSQKRHSPRRNRYWLAPEWDDVPVRAEQRKGEDLEWHMELEALQRPPPP
jgi:hypothetical protein